MADERTLSDEEIEARREIADAEEQVRAAHERETEASRHREEDARREAGE